MTAETTIWTVLLAVLAGSLPNLTSWLANRKKGKVETRKLSVDGDAAQLEQYKKMQTSLAECQGSVLELGDKCAKFEAWKHQVERENVERDRRLADREAHIDELYAIVKAHPGGAAILEQLRTKRPNGSQEGRQSK